METTIATKKIIIKKPKLVIKPQQNIVVETTIPLDDADDASESSRDSDANIPSLKLCDTCNEVESECDCDTISSVSQSPNVFTNNNSIFAFDSKDEPEENDDKMIEELTEKISCLKVKVQNYETALHAILNKNTKPVKTTKATKPAGEKRVLTKVQRPTPNTYIPHEGLLLQKINQSTWTFRFDATNNSYQLISQSANDDKLNAIGYDEFKETKDYFDVFPSLNKANVAHVKAIYKANNKEGKVNAPNAWDTFVLHYEGSSFHLNKLHENVDFQSINQELLN